MDSFLQGSRNSAVLICQEEDEPFHCISDTSCASVRQRTNIVVILLLKTTPVVVCITWSTHTVCDLQFLLMLLLCACRFLFTAIYHPRWNLEFQTQPLFLFFFFAGLSYFPLNEENEKMPSRVIYYNSWSASVSSLKSGDGSLPRVQWLMGCLWPTIDRPTIKVRLISQLWLSKINADSTLPFDVQSCTQRLGLSLCPQNDWCAFEYFFLAGKH